jgi:polyribonucleotide nucleotidyltransferase
MEQIFRRELGGSELIITTGKLAQQAGGSVTVQYGESLILVTATRSKSARSGIDFLPLTVDLEERLYAAGKIPGSFFRREGRPSSEAILAMRLTDRALRPLFPKSFHNDVHIVITTLSTDQNHPMDTLGTIGASAALTLSDIPFEGPVSSTRVAIVDGVYVINPTFEQLESSNLDLVVSGTADAVVMVEAGCLEVSESEILEGIAIAQATNNNVIEMQNQIGATLGKEKFTLSDESAKTTLLTDQLPTGLQERITSIVIDNQNNEERDHQLSSLVEETKTQIDAEEIRAALADYVHSIEKEVIRDRILREQVRPDGRETTQIRTLNSEAGLLPRTHGSGLFTRGQTQVLSIATLGSLAAEQKLDTLNPMDRKRFLHHYNMPPYASGEVGRLGTGRREIGHGNLAERALLAVVPDREKFPYTIRLVSEVMSSNGSTSMASVCASSLALMDAGVPITSPVAGIAMGLIYQNGDFQVLTDIQGLEDHLGDMDFKVAGTESGVTALQMDIKVKGITIEVMTQALSQAKTARHEILANMKQTLSESRADLSPHAPRVERLSIPTEKIGALIGPGGKTIRSISETYNVVVDVDNSGIVTIMSTDTDSLEQTISRIRALTQDVEVGATYLGKVVRIMNFGAFVEILPGKDGLVHISEIANQHVSSVEDVLALGDQIEVKVKEIDAQGRVSLSRKALLD